MSLRPETILRGAIGRYFPHVGFVTDFSRDDLALIDLIVRLNPNVKIFYRRTPYTFRETDEVLARLNARYYITPIGVERFDPRAWGLKALISSTRAEVAPFVRDGGLVRVNPLAGLTREEVEVPA